MRNKGKAHIPEQPSLWPPRRPETDRWLVHQAAAHRRALTQPDVTTPAGQGARWPMTLNVLQDYLNTKPWNFTKFVPSLKSKQKVPLRATCPCCSMDTTCPGHSLRCGSEWSGSIFSNRSWEGVWLSEQTRPGQHHWNKELQPLCPQHMWTGMHSMRERDWPFYFTVRHLRTGRPHSRANDLTPVLSFCWSSEEFKVSPYQWWSCVWGCQPWPPPE